MAHSAAFPVGKTAHHPGGKLAFPLGLLLGGAGADKRKQQNSLPAPPPQMAPPVAAPAPGPASPMSGAPGGAPGGGM